MINRDKHTHTLKGYVISQFTNIHFFDKVNTLKQKSLYKTMICFSPCLIFTEILNFRDVR